MLVKGRGKSGELEIAMDGADGGILGFDILGPGRSITTQNFRLPCDIENAINEAVGTETDSSAIVAKARKALEGIGKKI